MEDGAVVHCSCLIRQHIVWAWWVCVCVCLIPCHDLVKVPACSVAYLSHITGPLFRLPLRPFSSVVPFHRDYLLRNPTTGVSVWISQLFFQTILLLLLTRRLSASAVKQCRVWLYRVRPCSLPRRSGAQSPKTAWRSSAPSSVQPGLNSKAIHLLPCQNLIHLPVDQHTILK